MTRTDAILAEIRKKLEKRRHSIDSADDLRQVFIRVFLKPRSVMPKNTTINYEHADEEAREQVGTMR